MKKYNVLIYIYSEKRLFEYISFSKILNKEFNIIILSNFSISQLFLDELTSLGIQFINLIEIHKKHDKPLISRIVHKYFNFLAKFKRTNLGQKLFEVSEERLYLYYSKLISSIISEHTISIYVTAFDTTYSIQELGFIFGAKQCNTPIFLAYIINYHPENNYAIIQNNQNYLNNRLSCEYERNIFNQYEHLTYKNVHFYQAYLYKILAKYNMIPQVAWMQGGGFSDIVSVPNKHTYNLYRDFNISDNKLIILPDLSMQELFKSYITKASIKSYIVNKYNLESKKIILVGLANWYEHGLADIQTHREIIDYTLSATFQFHQEYSVLVTLHPSMEKENYLYIEEKYNVKILDERLFNILPCVDFYLADQSSTVIWSVLLEIKTLVIAVFKNFHLFDYLSSVKVVQDKNRLKDELSNLLNLNLDFSNDLKLLSKNEIFHDHIEQMYIDCLNKIIKYNQ